MILMIILLSIIIIILSIYYKQIDTITEKLSDKFSEDLFNQIKKYNYQMLKDYSKLYEINYIINKKN